MRVTIIELLERQAQLNMHLPANIHLQNGEVVHAMRVVEQLGELLLGYLVVYNGQSWINFRVWVNVNFVEYAEVPYWNIQAA